MVSKEQDIDRVVIVGTGGALGNRLAEAFSACGADVVGVALTPEASPEEVARDIGSGPIDVLIFADDWTPPDRGATEVTRADLAASLDRLTFTPFRLAGLLRPALAADGGSKLVLLSRTSATMEHVDRNGRYLERPFRAASHALWRCLSVEWQTDGIDCVLIALDDASDANVLGLPDTIAAATSLGNFVTLVDESGAQLPW